MQNARFAGFWIRFVAHLIDGFLITIGALIMIIPLFLFLGLSLGSIDRYGHGDLDPQATAAIIFVYVGIFVISIGINWLYFALFEASSSQATPGKMVVGVQVVGPQGGRISFARASGRAFGKFLSGMICNIGYIMAGFTEYKQALHDMMASTYVIYKEQRTISAPSYQAPPPPESPAS